MVKLVHEFEGGRLVLCTDGAFHDERSLVFRRLRVKTYQSAATAKRALAIWNGALGDYAAAVAA